MQLLSRFVTACLILAWLPAAAAAAQPPTMTVLVHVVDAARQPVADLAPADLELKIDGRVQHVSNVRTAASCAVLVLFDMNLPPYYPLLVTLGALPPANNASKVFRPGLVAYNAAAAEVTPGETAASKAVHSFYTGPLSKIDNAWDAVEAAVETLVPKAACGSILLVPNRGHIGNDDKRSAIVSRLIERRFSFHILIGRTMLPTGMPTRPGLDGQGGSNPLRPVNQGLITGPLVDATGETGGSQVRIDEPNALSGALVEMVRDLEGRVLLDVVADDLRSGSRNVELKALRPGLTVRAARRIRVP